MKAKEQIKKILESAETFMHYVPNCQKISMTVTPEFFDSLKVAYKALEDKEMKTTEIEDVVKVVRCKDCIYSDHWYGDHQLCTLWSEGGIGVFDDGFCNYGKESED